MTATTQQRAAFVLNNGGIIAHQTDTIFGLACLPEDKLLNRLARIKRRPADKTFLLLASCYGHVASFINVNAKAIEMLTTPTHVPTTWLVDSAGGISQHLIGKTNKVALRITDYQPIKALCEQVGAIASTSANISSHAVCTDAMQIRAMFGPSIDYVDPSQTRGTGKSSTIVDLSSGDIIRR